VDGPSRLGAPLAYEGPSVPAAGAAVAAPARDAAGDRLPVLDGIRGIAILLVMLLHFTPPVEGSGSAAARVLQKVAHLGWAGVDLFFVLSGFLITRILLASRQSPTYFRTFYLRRVLRIFPLYYLVLAFFAFGAPAISFFDRAGLAELQRDQAWLWLYGQNVLMSIRDSWVFDVPTIKLSHFWSLAVEEHFYLVWPAVVLLCRERQLLKVCAGIIAGAFLLRIVLWYLAGPIAPYVLTLCRADSLAMGGLLALVHRHGAFAPLRSTIRVAALASLVAAGAIVAVLHRFNRSDMIVTTLGPTLLACMFAWLIGRSVDAGTGTLGGRVLASGPLRMFGRYSYGLYVYHVILIPVLNAWLPRAGGPNGFGQPYVQSFLAAYLLRVLVFIAASLAVAAVSWHLIEAPILRLKRHARYG
jgi:peptidoglycan/LPS O-acetylase OafA/YrhL